MSSFDEWARFQTEVRLNSITSMKLSNSMAKLEDEFLLWAETERVSELMQRWLLVQFRLYEKQLQEAVDSESAPYANYDHLCIQFLECELNHINKLHRF
ncbi:hypothetical protein F511_27809 [Dorcoceras hygrometricum]|uniref:Uncharacterized protein n=1 Tax=Dorcoceras hygrometricum TaxID=472368 RepID=A0A2Z7CWM5_9LAMI|nr:hypothetical protein F511_27809 [Dorcoceras hygrometricum]